MKNLLRTYVQKSCTSLSWEKWFEPLSMSYNTINKQLTVLFPHVFFQTWFIQHTQKTFENIIQEFSKKYYGYTLHITYIQPTLPLPKAFFLQKDIQEKLFEHTFSDFFYNTKNDFPLAAIQEVTKGNFPPKYNPFVIYGKSSTGKTHILNAINNILVKKYTINIFQGTMHTFCENLSTKGIQEFVNTFSVFLIDDIQYYNSTEIIQNYIISFIDICLQKNKQLIFTANVVPQKLIQYKENLRSRLQAGLIVALKEADIDVRMRFALFHCKKYGIKISKNQLLYLAQRCTTIAYLRGIILKINAFQSLNKKECNYTDIENILNSTGTNTKNLSPQDIVHIVATYTDILPEHILQKKRQPHIVRARQISMYLCRDLLGMSYLALGKFFGGKDHSTVIHSIKKIKEIAVSNKDTHYLLTELKQKCLNA